MVRPDRVRVSRQRLKRSHFPEDSELMQCHFHHTLLFPPTCRRKESRSCGCSRTPQFKETWRGGGSFSITVPGYSTLVRSHSTAACDSRSCHIHTQKQREISVYIFSGVCSAPYIVQPGNGAAHSQLGLPHQLIKTLPYRCTYRPIQSRQSLINTLPMWS